MRSVAEKLALEPSDKTTDLPGIYANLIEVSAQPDGITRIVFKDQIGGEPKERLHVVLTAANAKNLGELLMTILQVNQAKQ